MKLLGDQKGGPCDGFYREDLDCKDYGEFFYTYQNYKTGSVVAFQFCSNCLKRHLKEILDDLFIEE